MYRPVDMENSLYINGAQTLKSETESQVEWQQAASADVRLNQSTAWAQAMAAAVRSGFSSERLVKMLLAGWEPTRLLLVKIITCLLSLLFPVVCYLLGIEVPLLGKILLFLLIAAPTTLLMITYERELKRLKGFREIFTLNPSERLRVAVSIALANPQLPLELQRELALRLVYKAFPEEWAIESLGLLPIREPALVDALFNLISSNDYQLRCAAIEALGVMQISDERVLGMLTSLLEDEHRAVRRSAAKALGLLSNKNTQVAEVLSDAVSDKDWQLRKSIIQSLGETDVKDPVTLKIICERLKDEEEEVAQVASNVIVRLGARDKAVVSYLLKTFADLETAPEMVATTLRKVVAQNPAAIEVLTARLSSPQWQLRRAAIIGIDICNGFNAHNLELLCQRLGDQDSNVRATAQKTLIRICSQDEQMMRASFESLKRTKALSLQRSVIEILCAVGASNSRSSSIINTLLSDPNWQIRQATAQVLGDMETVTEPAIKALCSRIADPDVRVRKTVLITLKKFSENPALISGLAGMLDSEDWQARQSAIAAFSELNIKDRSVIELVALRIADQDWRVREAALEFLSRVRNEEVIVDVLKSLLGNEDLQVRQEAVRLVIQFGIKNQAIISALCERLNIDGESEIREVAAFALGQMDIQDDTIIKTLYARLLDHDGRVRAKAAEALGLLHPSDPRITKALTRMAASDKDNYVRMAALNALENINININLKSNLASQNRFDVVDNAPVIVVESGAD